ncbi:MAG TPA: 50S ribosomal protein L21 [Syntrophales bacterium]|nr:50S ribosomal protein L21 [Syntrophales bacterium]HOL59513.1 50S ribosomal protein L21 [Syntrophales bacterium]HPO35603.1 50S ribosomal protein L21 [Syntrophales bacterium]
MMYAVIKTGGKQYRVSQGDEIAVEKLPGNRGEEVIFDQVLMWATDQEIKLGTPVVEGVKVISEIVRQEKGPKIYVFRMKRRKGYRKKTGHRQMLTRVKIKEIVIN